MQRIAIVGLGRVGSRFLEAMLGRASRGLEIAAVAETGQTPGRAAAEAAGIPVLSLNELLGQAAGIDIVFDLSGQLAVRQSLRQGLATRGNSRTVIAPESVARLVWSMLTSEDLPQVHTDTGY
ncbi:Gfo/Idh/MocA family oxidoreductase [Thiomonas sp. FB-6]|uniref:Gfo/Idh/MocA family oxidoreductase n=1 Tax=Thiomonas sp. FB-6 TaxID=1158291 RepID=UPI00035CBAA7|nr:Gfo/Idh/MocA family oxidoreductase [Thiomonas sp. FB-6]